jgi:RNA polymerase sigma factor (sigma-70 family)
MPNRGRGPSFAEAYDEHVWHVYGFFAYRLGRREDAEDLTQQTFERALKAWPRYDPRRATPGTWLLSIARNLLIDHHRSDRSDRHTDVDAAEHAATTSGPEADVGLDPAVERALAALSPRERETVALRFGADLTNRRIARVTGTSTASVDQALSRALRRMRSIMDEGEQDPGASTAGQHTPSSPS